MADPKTPARAADLRASVDNVLRDTTAFSVEELVALGVEVTLLPEGPREEVAHVRDFHPLRDSATGWVMPAPQAE